MIEPAQVDIFYGDAHEALARVYVRVASDTVSSDVRIAGTISGPTCIYARTLPSHFRLTELPSGAEPLAEAVVPDPCFWSPTEPYRYTARIRVSEGDVAQPLPERTFGIRRFGARGSRLYLDGKNWVARIVENSQVDYETLPRWREASASLLAHAPSDELCEAASQIGVFMLAAVRGEAAHVTAELRRLSRHAAVGMALVDPIGEMRNDLRDACPNVLLAAKIDVDHQQSSPPWAHVAMVEHADLEKLSRWVATSSLPVIARRHDTASHESEDIETRRAACDRLQTDLAGRCDPAAYCV